MRTDDVLQSVTLFHDASSETMKRH